jgi:hypothetical protein
VDRYGADLAWHVVADAAGAVNKVTVGEPPAAVEYFYLYADEPCAESCVV